MKRALILVIFCLNILSVHSQLPYKFVLGGPYDDEPVKAIELNNGSILVSYTSKYNNQFISHNLLTLDQLGNLVDMTELECPGTNFYISEMVQIDDNTIICIGKMEYADHNADICILSISPNLDIRWTKKHRINYPYIHFLSACLNCKGNIAIAATVAETPVVFPSFCMFMEVDMQGDHLQTNYPGTLSNTNILFDIVEDKATGNYLIPAFGLLNYANSFGQFLTVDTIFQITQVDSIVHRVYNCCTIMQTIDSTFLIAGTRNNSSATDISMVKFDRNNQLIRFADIGKTGEVQDYGGLRQSMDFRYPSSIYVAGTINIFIYGDFGWDSSWYVVSSFDSLLTPKWTKYYGGDAYYRLNGVTATRDKGCVLWGTRFDHNTQAEERDLVVLKVTEQGLITGFENSEALKAHDAIVYPNPGRDVLHVQSGPQIAGSAFILYDPAGKIVLSSMLNTRLTALDTSALPAGIYVWYIEKGSKIIETGKWIRQ